MIAIDSSGPFYFGGTMTLIATILMLWFSKNISSWQNKMFHNIFIYSSRKKVRVIFAANTN